MAKFTHDAEVRDRALEEAAQYVNKQFAWSNAEWLAQELLNLHTAKGKV